LQDAGAQKSRGCVVVDVENRSCIHQGSLVPGGRVYPP
jgi:hypothetical protein